MKTCTAAAHRAYAALLTATLLTVSLPAHRSRPATTARGEDRATSERGDVPGWVMITMMTAIVVIVLLGVFQEAVVNAVKNAFDSISGQGGAPAPAGQGAVTGG